MSEIKIRHSSGADVESITMLYEGENAYSYTLQLPFPSLDKWRKRLSELPQGMYSLVAEMDGEIVGQIGLEAVQVPRRRHVGQIGMAVKDDFQGQGVGGKLMGAAIDLAENWLNISRIELTVFTDNEPAMALYKKYEFQIEGEGVNYAFRNGKFVNVYHMARIRKP
jgi:putative acetyltransferase